MFVDIAFNSIWDKSDQSNFIEINGYENFIGGLGSDTIVGFSDNSLGIVGGQGLIFYMGQKLIILDMI